MTNNVFASAARTVANMTVTENGHAAASTTGSALLDLYWQVGALRGQDEARICQLLDAAVAEDRLLATKIIFYARDCRGGTGEREVFRTLLKHMARIKPNAVIENLELIPEFGRWDDLYSVANPVEFPEVSIAVWDLINKQLFKDESALAEGKPVSLLGKWLKSCNASSKETRRLGRMTAEQLGYSEKEYRKLLSRLRERIRVVECQMSAQKWDKIDYEMVPSKRAGYKMPQVIYWNVESRDNHFQTRSDVPGTMLASGSSPRVFEAVMAMQDFQATPYDAMLEVLNGDRYKEVK